MKNFISNNSGGLDLKVSLSFSVVSNKSGLLVQNNCAGIPVRISCVVWQYV